MAGPIGNIAEASLAEIWNSEEMQRLRRLHAAGRAGEIDMCSRCCTTIPHPMLVAGSLILHGRTVRKWLPRMERLIYSAKLPKSLLTPPRRPSAEDEFIQIDSARK